MSFERGTFWIRSTSESRSLQSLASQVAGTGCKSLTGLSAGAGSESPTVLPENEDGLLRGVLTRVPSRLRPSGCVMRSSFLLGVS